RAVAEVFRPARATIVAHERTWLCRGRGRRHIAAERIVALEVVGRHIVHVNVAAGGDVFLREADDLPVLLDRLALLDRDEGKLVPQADTFAECQPRAIRLNVQPGFEITSGNGDVVFGTQVNGHLGKGDKRHEESGRSYFGI